LSTISRPNSVYGDKAVLICCNGTVSVISIEEDVLDDDEEGDRNRPIVVEEGCWAAWKIGRAYAA
jgi:hypothetical protein